MMQHASNGTGQRESTDVNSLVSEHIDLAYHGKRTQVEAVAVKIKQELDPAAGLVEMVPQDIGRVLLNLVGNAIDAVHDHAVSTRPVHEDGLATTVQDQHDLMNGDSSSIPTVTVSTRRLDDHVEIRVTDNGPGIPAEIREKIFEPFFTTKPTGTGTGLGLSLSYDIVTQGHGGTLTVEDEKGGGATFVVSLPSA